MLVKNYKPVLMPITVNTVNWFEEWYKVGLKSGKPIPEVIPDGVFWASIEDVFNVNTAGTYLSLEA